MPHPTKEEKTMTLKDFATKYQIPYYIAYNASYAVKHPVAEGSRGREYDEKDLYSAVENDLVGKITRHSRIVESNKELLGQLRKNF